MKKPRGGGIFLALDSVSAQFFSSLEIPSISPALFLAAPLVFTDSWVMVTVSKGITLETSFKTLIVKSSVMSEHFSQLQTISDQDLQRSSGGAEILQNERTPNLQSSRISRRLTHPNPTLGVSNLFLHSPEFAGFQ